MVDPIPVPSSQTGGSLHQSTFYDELQDNTTRLSKLERVSRLGNASIGEGGLRIYSAGELQWFDSNTTPTNFCPDLRDLTTDPNGNSHLSFIIRTIPVEETTGDFSQASLLYYYPYEGFCSPVVWLGRTPDFANGPGDSHGIEVRIHTSGARAFHASEDGVILGRRDDTGIRPSGTTRVLSSVRDSDDDFHLYTDDGIAFSRYFGVRNSSGHDDAQIIGGMVNGAAGAPSYDLKTRLTLKGTTAKVVVTDEAGASAPIDALQFNIVPSSENMKRVHGSFTADALSEVVATPIQEFSMLRFDTEEDRAAFIKRGKPPLKKHPTLDEVHVGPVAEDVPARMRSEPGPGEVAGISLNAGLWTLWRAVQQQQDIITEQASRITALETQLADFRQRLTAVENR